MNACADKERWLARMVDGTADVLTDAERAAKAGEGLKGGRLRSRTDTKR